jgi:hypothetical protein
VASEKYFAPLGLCGSQRVRVESHPDALTDRYVGPPLIPRRDVAAP